MVMKKVNLDVVLVGVGCMTQLVLVGVGCELCCVGVAFEIHFVPSFPSLSRDCKPMILKIH